MRLADVRAIVTGAASGLGWEFALSLVRAGAGVVAVDIDEEGLAALASAVGDAPGELHVRRGNVTRHDDVTAAVAGAIRAFGQVNVLINNAGIYRDGLMVKRAGEGVIRMPLAQWQTVLDVDLTGPFLFGREVAARMIELEVGEGVLVNVSSVMRHGNAGQSNYSAAKAGVVALTRVWADELAPFRIRAAAVAPGFIRTPMIEATDPETLAEWTRRIPLRRWGEPAEVFAAVRFILECGYFTGRCIDLDGGLRV